MITQEERQKIFEEYCDRNITTTEIAERHSLRRSEIAHIAVEMGAEPRSKKAYGKHKQHLHVCPKCRKRIDVKGAKFCCFCGTDIRSEKDLLIERINKAFEIIPFLPEAERDELQKLFLDITAQLKK